jgi:phosphoadenosine phosphosulfate reductase
MGALEETMEILRDARTRSDSVLVSFSGGKDSLVVLDLCMRTFSRVEAFFMQWVPGLACAEDPAIAGAERNRVKLHMVPHWNGMRCLKAGFYCMNGPERDDWPDVKLRDIYSMVIADTGIPLIAMGGKRKDGLWRKRNLDSTKNWAEVVTPIVGWSNHDVAAHLVARKIPIPKGDSKDGSGVDLSKPSVLWMYDNHPDDYATLADHFEFVGAIVEQRRMFGGKKTSNKR